MPYVSNGTDFGIDLTDISNMLQASQFMRPVAGVLPSGILTLGAFSATAQTYTNLATYYWDSDVFNKQGQRWEALTGTVSDGCRNAATPRTSGGVRYNHIVATEFVYTGTALDIAFIGSAYYDILVYVEYMGRMYRAEAAPRSGTTTGLRHLPLNFGASYNGRIRIVLAGGSFVGIKCEQSALVKKSPDRIFAVLDGSEWSEGAGIKQASGTSYLVGSLGTYLFEYTGWVWANRAQPDTGYFRNGASTVTDDTATSTNQTRFFSQSRRDWVAPDFVDKPLFYLVTGSRPDGGASGATGASNGPMATRVKACIDWIRTKDRYTKVVQMSVSPNGSGTGHAQNFTEQGLAIASSLRAETIDTSSWFNSAQMAPLIGVDGINPNDDGFKYWASKIVEALSAMLVHNFRARRLR